ncbi:GntR family transcriptional regulator [Ammoniphilus sp. YIM 78166]|uniref:GntR family transcriptional regulator n=1 Tax=Ammoniphilus sp. YIM 78166 TaxID=1644106 RepID=UPI0010705187|nr:GntR family transcriptional regulator [Ammoniphilus sp. YIM 78166]
MNTTKSQSRADMVYAEMKKAILYGYPNFMPDDFLIENKLAEYYNVSKTPVREALSRLRYESLVEVIPYKGYFVTNLSYQDLVDLFELRLILETNITGLAAQNITSQQLEELEGLTDQGIIDLRENLSLQFRKLNFEFHSIIADASGNKWMADVFKQVVQQMQRSLFHKINEKDLDELFEEHRELLAFLRDRDSQGALELVRMQIEKAKERVFQSRKQT